MRYMLEFPRGIPHFRAGYPRVTHPSATQPRSCPLGLVRLACVKHAASVHSEPGSNSPLKVFSRHGLPKELAPSNSSQILFFDTGNSAFSKKAGKRRLARSTQFSRNRIPGLSPSDDAVLPA